MATIKAFRSVRPREELASKIAALPYDVYNRQEAQEEVKREPLSFLRIDRAETQFPADVDTYDPRVYQKAKELLWNMIEEGKLLKEDTPCYYIYEMTMGSHRQTGLVACASIEDYENKIIKKHENTRAEKEEDRIQHVDICNAQTGPIFLAYRANPRLTELIEETKQEKPVYDFVAADGILHRVWVIAAVSKIEEIQTIFQTIQNIYIADGHHRAASAVKVGLKRRKEHPDYTGEEEFNYFLSVLFPDEELKILDYNRVVKDLHGYTPQEFIAEVEKKFIVTCEGEKAVQPKNKGTFGMYLVDCWYQLVIKEEYRSEDPVEGLDVALLQNNLLGPILGITDPKTDDNISFVGGIRGLLELERRVQLDAKVAFSMYPTSISELFAVADADLLMPPKSTWFEPKLRSGLFIHTME